MSGTGSLGCDSHPTAVIILDQLGEGLGGACSHEVLIRVEGG